MRKSQIWLVCLFAWLLGACTETAYYWQAVEGHFGLLQRKQNIDSILASPDSSPQLRKKLQLLRNVRQFAVQDLQLPAGNGYSSYVELPRSYVSVLVSAAPPLTLRAHQWCYLIIGCQGYRGYFAEEDAEALARELEEEGFDVSISYATAYSTLGYLNQSWMPDYFSDPVLSTFLNRGDVALAATLIHEMAHQVVFVAGDTAFNESYASFVEEEGTRQYLRKVGRVDDLLILEQASADRLRFRQYIQETALKLEKLYQSEKENQEKLAEKERILQALQERYANHRELFQQLKYDNWFNRELNNAHILGVRRYQNYVPAFAVLFERVHRDWPRFYQEVKNLANMSAANRQKQLDQLLAASSL